VLLRGCLESACRCLSPTCSNRDVDGASSSHSEQDEHELEDGGDEQMEDEAEEVGDASVVIVDGGWPCRC